MVAVRHHCPARCAFCTKKIKKKLACREVPALNWRVKNSATQGVSMRKRILLLPMGMVAAAAMFVATKPATAGYGMAGCGLGSLVVSSNGFAQVFAATTNSTYYNQSFGITSGTSNCTPAAAAYVEKQQEIFVTVNFASLEQEMAAGKGEKLEALASLLGCKNEAVTGFRTMAQKNHGALFSKDASPADLLAALKGEIAKQPALAAQCRI